MTGLDKQRQIDMDVWSTWDWAMDSLYGKFHDVMERHDATLDEMVKAIEKYCDWDTAEGFKEWYGEG